MTTYRLISLLCAFCAVCLGILYLTVGDSTLPFVLPLMSTAFWTIAALRYAETRAAGTKGILALLPTLAIALVAIFATLGTLVYLMK